MTAEPPPVLSSLDECAKQVAAWEAAGDEVACVPTMGALHRGHLALVDRARDVADRVVVSIFVNPLQFGRGEDFDRYPRTLESDLPSLAGRGVDAVLVPSVPDIYPDWPDTQTTEDPGVVGTLFEGASRPGHFAGMLTVVRRLIEGVGAKQWVFGEKDAQQLFLVRQMVANLGLPAVIHSVPTVRDPDGLALSSRNQYLSATEREQARALSRELEILERALHDLPAWTADSVRTAVASGREHLLHSPGVTLDYLEAVSPESFSPVSDPVGSAVQLIVAAKVGSTRLIDQRLVHRQETGSSAAQ